MVERVLVVGGGTMGRGIAQAVATAGIPVVLRELSPGLAGNALDGIKKSLQRAVEKGKLAPGEADAAVFRIQVTGNPREGSEAQLVIEAIVEDLLEKQSLFAELGSLVAPDAILATNTSALSISQIASVTSRPERVLGMHFFNPAPAMKLVEIVRGERTAPEVVAAARAFVERIGKTPVEVRETPGFVVNRLLIPMINEAVFALEEGLATAKEIDDGMKAGCNHPIGPLALADLIGLDTVLSVMNVFYDGFNDPKYRPAPLLKEMVDAGYLGRKTGRGFYPYK